MTPTSISYAPSNIVEPFIKLAFAILKYPGFTVRMREIIILATTSVFRNEYIMYAHKRIGMEAGLSASQVSEALSGTTPQDLDRDEEAVYKFARGLADARGPLDEEIWQRAKSSLGTEKVAVLVHLVGAYAYSNILVNAADVKVPESEVA